MIEQFNLWELLAGLAVFLFGMNLIEQALKNLSSRTFKMFLKKHTGNRVKAIFSGTFITAILQSSSIVSLMVLAFVGAGIIELKNAIGIILGSNLGTTFTGWIVAILGFKLSMENLALPLLSIGGFIYIFFNKKEKLANIGTLTLGLGFLLLGLGYMKMSIEGFTHEFDISYFKGMNAYLFFFVGLILTAIIQSSSASMVITLSALNIGIITLDAAAAMVIGSDLGTTITVLIGAVKGIPAKKRVALSHLIFNLITAIIALISMPYILKFIQEILQITDSLFALVLFHNIFNLLGIIIMFPFIGLLAKFLEKAFKNKKTTLKEFISKVSPEIPDAAIEAIKKEISNLSTRVFYYNIHALQINTGLFSIPKYIDKKESQYSTKNQLHQRYNEIKILGGEIISYHIKIQNNKLDDIEKRLLNQYMNSTRRSMTSIKEIKDILHDINEFENSSNKSKYSLYHFLKGTLTEFYLKLQHTLEPNNPKPDFEMLTDLISENQNIYNRFLQQLYILVKKNKLNELEITTSMNLNREIYQANKQFILSIKDILLSSKESEDFDQMKLSK